MKHRWWIFHSSKLQLVWWRNSGCVLEWMCFLVSCLMAASLKADLSPKTVAFLQTHCFGCHGEAKQKGDLRLDTLS
ncbi:MAG: c-type cytochrome domain-containing protein, partial [Limisphaerales bacterium]